MRVYTGRFKITRAKSGVYGKRARAYEGLVILANAHACLHGALEMDFGIFPNKLMPYAASRATAVLTKRACALLSCCLHITGIKF